jgi:hypothetical protein
VRGKDLISFEPERLHSVVSLSFPQIVLRLFRPPGYFAIALVLFGSLSSDCSGAEWKIEDQSVAQDPGSPFIHEKKVISKAGETGFFSTRTIDLIWFHAADYTFKVIDNGPDINAPVYPGLAAAMQRNGCLAGCNGGFFLKDHGPSGLMISQGTSTGKFGEGSLLSGVVLSSGNRNPYLLRRAEFDSGKSKATDLIQCGPFLVDQGKSVRGLSPENSRRRTFIAHDGGKWFALGLSDAFTLAEMGEILSQSGFSPSRKLHRALNLDGGTSSGLYFERGSGDPVAIEPYKTVRNFVGIVPRQKAE